MAFPSGFLDELRSRVRLSSVVGRHVKLTRKGREYQGLCPFHNEKTPSFSVNEDKGFFHCFGCGAHGDAIAFEMRLSHLSFSDAIEKLAAEAGMEVPQATQEERQAESRRASLHDAMEAACQFYEAQLHSAVGREGLAYLKNRGLSDETIARFRLGWSPDNRYALKTAIMSDQIPEALLSEAGLLKKPEGDGTSFDMFRGRVMFPISDRRGRIIAFGARTLGDGQPKYLNSPETPLFHKGRTLYALAQARDVAAKGNQVLAVEGYMDVIALHQAGFTFAVAPLGTALTEDQIEELWKLADEPILCFDGDAAGQRAMARASGRCLPILHPGKSLRFAVLPPSDDPDSLIRSKGIAAMRAILDAASPLIDVIRQLRVDGQTLNTPERKAAAERDLMEQANSIADESVRRQYVQTLKDRLYTFFRPPRSFVKRGTFAPPNGLRGPDGRLPGIGKPPPPRANALRQERLLLSILLSHPILVERVADQLGQTEFVDSDLDKIRCGILKHADTAHVLDVEGLCTLLRSDGMGPLLDPLLEADEYRICRDQTDKDATIVWEHVFTLGARDSLQTDVGRAIERLGRETSDANWSRLLAMVSSSVRSIEYDDND